MTITEALRKAVEGGYHIHGSDGMATTYAGASRKFGSVANYRKQESWVSQVIDFPRHDFRILPRKGNFATEPTSERSSGLKNAATAMSS
jgi:hypothetical protein